MGVDARAARFNREYVTIRNMVAIHCTHKHTRPGLCADCRELLEYSKTRLEKCPYDENKPTCSRCTIHCYDPAHRERIKAVMKYAGPRMLLYHPAQALRHLIDELNTSQK
jgi:predicted amidophosphoribosyltransferase